MLKNVNKKVIWFGTAALFFLSFAYLSRGFYNLIFLYPTDLKDRWEEFHLMLKGVFPGYCYPPWAILTGAVFYFPKWTFVPIYYAFWNIIALALICAWSVGFAPAPRKEISLFLLSSVSAISAYCTSLGTGNYGIIVTACLVCTLWLSEKGMKQRGRYNIFSGLLFSVALIKPTLSAPFAIALLIKNRFKEVFIAIIYIFLTTVLVSAMVKLNPIQMIYKNYVYIRPSMDLGYGIPQYMIKVYGLNRNLVTLLVGFAAVFCGGIIMLYFRKSSLPVHFAIAAVISRLWIYHYSHDNLILFFLLLPLTFLIFKKTSALTIIAFLSVGLSLWAPARLTDLQLFQVFQHSAWIFGLFVLLVTERREAIVFKY